MEPNQATVIPGVNDSRSAARALSARNAVRFECLHSLEACREKLTAISVPVRQVLPRDQEARQTYAQKMVPIPPVLVGIVTDDQVDLAWDSARFQGHWVNDASGLHLTGHVGSNASRFLMGGAVAVLVLAAVSLKVASDTHWEGKGLYFLLVSVAIAVIGMPLLVLGLGSARVASEIELVRAIGLAIGDPEKYAARWRKIRDD